jgi:hypothetical protein
LVLPTFILTIGIAAGWRVCISTLINGGPACMAFMWGAYINGIAVYGRDPVLTCEYAYFLTVDQACPYVNCYIEGLANPPNATNPDDTNKTAVKSMIPPDWRNCSVDSYHG